MPETATVQITMPEMGESVTEGIVLEWHVAEGDAVKEGDTVVEVSTDKVDAEVPAPADGVITKLIAQVDDEVPVGAPLAEMESGEGQGSRPAGPVAAGDPPPPARQEGVPPTTPPTGAAQSSSDSNGGNGAADVKATPVARRIAEATGVDLASVSGSGPGSKVTKEDVIAAADGGGNGASASAAKGDAKQLRGAAAMLAQAMDESRAVPTATSFRTIAVDTLDAKRKAINPVLKDRGLKVSFTHLVAWAIVQATKDFPVMTRVFASEDGKPFAIEGNPANLGIAVDVEKKDGSHSLMVPAIKGADGLGFSGFHSNYEELIAKTRENKLSADDFQGTNISLTNPGGIGTMASVPRLLSGQSAIIATGSIAYPPEWRHASPERIKQLGVSKVMTLTSTYDHRVIQGAESGAFLRRVEELLQGEDELLRGGRRRPRDRSPGRQQRPPRLRLAGAAQRRRAQRRTEQRPGAGRRRAAAGGAGGDLGAEGLPHPRPPRRPPRPARVRAEGRPGAGARERQPDPGADVADPRLDPADRRPRRNPARGAAADARPPTAARSATSSSTSPRTSSGSGCGR